MAKPTPQQCHALITYFISRYEDVVGSKPTINRNKARWGFESILFDLDPAAARELVDYFLEHYDPNLDWFLWNYEKVAEAMQDAAKQKEQAAIRRKETQQRLDAWRQRWQK